MPQESKIPDAKAAVEKEWEKLEKIPAWQLTKVKNKKEVIEEARIQEQKEEEEERVVSKSRAATMNISSFIATSSSAASSSIACKSPRMPRAAGKPDSKMSVEPNSFDATSTSQARLKDVYFGGLMEKQWRNPSHQEEEEDSEDSDMQGKQVTEKPVAQNSKASGEILAHGASSSVEKESQKDTDAT